MKQTSRETTDTEVINVPIPTEPDTGNSSTTVTPAAPEPVPEDTEGTTSTGANVDPSPPVVVPERRYPQRNRKPNPRYS